MKTVLHSEVGRTPMYLGIAFLGGVVLHFLTHVVVKERIAGIGLQQLAELILQTNAQTPAVNGLEVIAGTKISLHIQVPLPVNLLLYLSTKDQTTLALRGYACAKQQTGNNKHPTLTQATRGIGYYCVGLHFVQVVSNSSLRLAFKGPESLNGFLS